MPKTASASLTFDKAISAIAEEGMMSRKSEVARSIETKILSRIRQLNPAPSPASFWEGSDTSTGDGLERSFCVLMESKFFWLLHFRASMVLVQWYVSPIVDFV